MDHKNRCPWARMLLREFTDSSLLVRTKVGKYNKSISVVIETMISTIKYSQVKTFLQNLLLFVLWFSVARNSCSVKVLFRLMKETYFLVCVFHYLSLASTDSPRKFFLSFLPKGNTIPKNAKVYCLKSNSSPAHLFVLGKRLVWNT